MTTTTDAQASAHAADIDLATRVRLSLAANRRGFTNVSVWAQSGTVRLSGRVRLFFLRQMAITLAKKVVGVHQVVDDLEVDPKASEGVCRANEEEHVRGGVAQVRTISGYTHAARPVRNAGGGGAKRFSRKRSHAMQATIELPKAFSASDDREFSMIQHLMERLNPKLLVVQVATGVNVRGGSTVHWGIVYLEGDSLQEKDVQTALEEAGLDSQHNAEIHALQMWDNDPRDVSKAIAWSHA
jgi:hypothetical protein